MSQIVNLFAPSPSWANAIMVIKCFALWQSGANVVCAYACTRTRIARALGAPTRARKLCAHDAMQIATCSHAGTDTQTHARTRTHTHTHRAVHSRYIEIYGRHVRSCDWGACVKRIVHRHQFPRPNQRSARSRPRTLSGRVTVNSTRARAQNSPVAFACVSGKHICDSRTRSVVCECWCVCRNASRERTRAYAAMLSPHIFICVHI